MTITTFNKHELAQFTGTSRWYRHAIVRDILFTDGAKYVADQAGAYWLLDEIAFAQRKYQAVAATPFQHWKLKVNCDGTAVLTCEDGDSRIVHERPFAYTNFPKEGMAFYFYGNTILLLSEY